MKVCWNITNLCNENCYYCFRDLFEKARSYEDNVAVLDKLAKIGVKKITFAGGEPLLYPGIDRLMALCRCYGISVAIITNGSRLTPENLDQYLPYIEKLTFSVDSPDMEVNDKLGRGIRHYKHIKELLPYIKEQYPDIILEVNTVASRENLCEIPYLEEELGTLTKYGIKKWKISRFCPLRGRAKEKEFLYSVSESDFQEIKEKYDGKKIGFVTSVRDFDAIDENIIVSAGGSLKKSDDLVEQTIVDDILSQSSGEIVKKLTRGGYYV